MSSESAFFSSSSRSIRSMKARRWPELTSSVPIAISSFLTASAMLIPSVIAEGAEVALNGRARQGQGSPPVDECGGRGKHGPLVAFDPAREAPRLRNQAEGQSDHGAKPLDKIC